MSRLTAISFFLFWSYSVFGQLDFVSIEKLNTNQQDEAWFKEKNKPLNEQVTFYYTFKENFTGSISFFTEFQPKKHSDNRSHNAPFTKDSVQHIVVDNAKAGDTNSVVIQIQVPSEYYNFDTTEYIITVSAFVNNEFNSFIIFKQKIRCEATEYLTLQEWESGFNANFSVRQVLQKENHLLVTVDRTDGLSMDFKIILQSKQIFKVRKLEHFQMSVFTAPMKHRNNVESILAPSFVDAGFHNLGLHMDFASLTFYKYSAFGRVNKHAFGIGCFISPSVHTVSYVYKNEDVVEVEPLKKSFLAFGLTLNYNFNGLGFHIIPLAYDLQLHSFTNSTSIYNAKIWTGFGLSYSLGTMNFLRRRNP